jgi:thioredoxin:protein disulfide reductase
MPIRHFLTRLLRAAGTALLLAAALAGQAVRAADDFLPPERAFQFSARTLDARSVEVQFTVAPGYYLYREQFRFAADGATLGTPAIPAGKVKFDETFQKDVETYRGELRIVVPVVQAPQRLRLVVTSQGCADKGLCYPPMDSAADLSLTGFGGDGGVRVLTANEVANLPAAGPGSAAAAIAAATATGSDPNPAAQTRADGAAAPAAAFAVNTNAPGDTFRLDAALRGGSFWPVVGLFFVAGVLLSLTPCVLPMLPILSSIIVGQGGETSRSRGLAMAGSYSLGMALVYTALGVAAGLAGEGLAAWLQNPWVLGLFALGLVALSLSMFGVYELQLPGAVTGPLTSASQRMPAGRTAGVFGMGAVSALIVSPCVAAPLAGAMVYLSQTRDVWLGGSALFALACGMSVPLLLLGASAGALLPRAGAWMNEVKRFFGLLLLAVAVWTVQSLMPGAVVLALWGALAVAAAVMVIEPRRLHGAPSRHVWRHVVGAVLGLVGLLQFVGAASGGNDPLQPLAQLRGDVPPAGLKFTMVRSVAEFDAALQSAGRPVMLDFYADWCVSCKEMERFTFSDAQVQAKLAGALLLKADVTKNNADDRALLKRFGLFGPPGTLFFDASGREHEAGRVIGFQNSTQFLRTLSANGL